MSKKRCMVVLDFIGVAGILVKKGSMCDVLQDENDFIWINPYIDEIGENIPFPIFRGYIQYI